MSTYIRVFRCSCTKIHLRAGVNTNSRCTCGLLLWDRMWRYGR